MDRTHGSECRNGCDRTDRTDRTGREGGCDRTDGNQRSDGVCRTDRYGRSLGDDWANRNDGSNRRNRVDGTHGTHRCRRANWSHGGNGGKGSNGSDGMDGTHGTHGTHGSPRTHRMDRKLRRHRSHGNDRVLLLGSNGSNPDPDRSTWGLWNHWTDGGSGDDRREWADGRHRLSWSPWTDGVDGCSLDGTRWASPVVNDWGRRLHWTHRTSLGDGCDGSNGVDGTDRLDGVDGTDGTDRLDGVDGVDGTDRLDGTCHRDDWTDGTSIELSSLSHLKSPSECNRLVQRSHHWSHCNDKLPPLRSLRAEWTPACPGLFGHNAHPNRDSGVSRVL